MWLHLLFEIAIVSDALCFQKINVLSAREKKKKQNPNPLVNYGVWIKKKKSEMHQNTTQAR